MGRLLEYFKSIFMGDEQVQNVGNGAVGIQCRGDFVGGNLNVRDLADIADGSYIQGDLKVGTPDKDAPAKILKNLAKMDLRVGGRVIINGQDVTDEYRKLRRS